MDDILKKQAFEKWYFLDDLMEYNRLLRVGMFQGSDFKSVEKMHKFLEDSWKNAKKDIEENAWYKAEKAAMEELDMTIIMDGGSGQYDPNYTVKMEDVFRKVFKEDKKKLC